MLDVSLVITSAVFLKKIGSGTHSDLRFGGRETGVSYRC
jgi:hypothetical protein